MKDEGGRKKGRKKKMNAVKTLTLYSKLHFLWYGVTVRHQKFLLGQSDRRLQIIAINSSDRYLLLVIRVR